MAISYNLKLRSSSSPHLYLDTIKDLIKDDDELLPATKKALLLMKRLKKSFVQIPLQMQVIVSPILKCNLERALSPALGQFNFTEWSDENVVSYKKDSKAFLEKVKNLYIKMGYDVTEIQFDDKKAEELLKLLSKEQKERLEKLNIKQEEPKAIQQFSKQVSNMQKSLGSSLMPQRPHIQINDEIQHIKPEIKKAIQNNADAKDPKINLYRGPGDIRQINKPKIPLAKAIIPSVKTPKPIPLMRGIDMPKLDIPRIDLFGKKKEEKKK